MNENVKKNSEGNAKKQMFVKGGVPGPGRGHKKEKVEIDGDLLDAIEKVVRTGMGAKDLKDRLKAAGIGIRVKQLKGSADDKPIMDSFTMNLFDLLHNLAQCQFNKTGNPMSAFQVVERMLRVCVDCDRLGTQSKDPGCQMLDEEYL